MKERMKKITYRKLHTHIEKYVQGNARTSMGFHHCEIGDRGFYKWEMQPSNLCQAKWPNIRKHNLTINMLGFVAKTRFGWVSWVAASLGL